ncbi:MAG: glycosyltransferase [Deltaproteobacteria bacterium]|nr:glycosyltransferase [Desulfitobacteriaceae bacterium]MDI6854780.1 glycosyltransferase [Deltaproteobacteria bacterium]
MNRKIMFVIPSLTGGGAEKTLVTLLKNLNREVYTPLLVLFQKIITYEDDMPDDINIVNFDKKSRYDNFRLIRDLARAIKKETPSIICSFISYTNFITLIACQLLRTKVPVVLSVHNNATEEFRDNKYPWLRKLLTRYLYPKADLIHCVSQGLKADLVNNFSIESEKIKVIYNPIDTEKIAAMALEEVRHPWFQEDVPVLLACGRLATQKNYPLLLRALRQVNQNTKARLLILGEGEQRNFLENYAKELGLFDKVEFLGFRSNPFQYMARATAFVLSSSHEGFGRVIVEAMACGLPVISTRCPDGPDEIIANGQNGFLVPVNMENPLARAILEVLRNEPLRRKFIEEGKKRAEDFSLTRIIPQFEEMFAKFC